MKLARVCLISLGWVGGALACGVIANAAIDYMMPASDHAAREAEPAPVESAQPAFTLASASATPTEIAPIRVKTIPIMIREEHLAEPAAEPAAAVPLPRPRPASAPAAVMAMGAETTASIARQPGAMAISAATRKAAPDNGDPLSPAGIDRMKTALALTAEQEEFWPAIAAELRAVGKMLKGNPKGQSVKLSVDNEQIQRLYWAAAPLITRLTPEQKHKAKQMARLMGLEEVAAAL